MRLSVLLACVGVLAPAFAAERSASDDPYRWLEDIEGADALAWVRAHNDVTARRLTARADYASLYRDALAALDAKSRIPEVEPHGGFLYNFWRDDQHPRGIYRRATLAEFRRANPSWETVLDVDELGKREGKPWAFGGATWRREDQRRCLIRLSPGGGDAAEVREFDVATRSFVADGFKLPVAKSNVSWRDANTLWVATDFGPGTLTPSGYPRVVKSWRRGTPLPAATTMYTADAKSVSVRASHRGKGTAGLDIIREQLTFWTSRYFRVVGEGLQELPLPATANVVDTFASRLVVWLKDDWSTGGQRYPAGSVLLVDPNLVGATPRIEVVVSAADNLVVRGVQSLPDAILVTALDNVRGRLLRLRRGENGDWRAQPVAFPDNGALKIDSTDDDTGEAWVSYESFLTPPTLFRIAPGDAVADAVKRQEPSFVGARFAVQQLWTTSADGTKIPYFVVGPKNLRTDGSNPVWMFSYGGFETALTPSYSGSYEDLHGAYGKLWLERGGVFVLANIRGGGEFGPRWHTSVLKENHYKCFEDFEAVARDLVARKITTPARLGIEGRSNGGLLVGATMLRHPELYGAVVCGNPLLDMQRYHRLLAGASWVAEYGDPDRPEEWAFIREYSPYQRLRPGLKLPPVMFYTSTRDDRVHPGHARKMMAKMEALGYAADYYENTEGGHHGSVTNEQLATRLARTFAFLWEKLGK